MIQMNKFRVLSIIVVFYLCFFATIILYSQEKVVTDSEMLFSYENSIKGNGKSSIKNYNIGSYSKLVCTGNFIYNIQIDNSITNESIEIITDENLQSLFFVDTVDSQLTFFSRSSFESKSRPIANIKIKKLEALQTTDNSTTNCSNVSTNQLLVETRDNSILNISGIADSLIAFSSDNSKLNSNKFVCKDAIVNAKDNSILSIKVENSLKCDLQDNSKINLLDKPKSQDCSTKDNARVKVN